MPAKTRLLAVAGVLAVGALALSRRIRGRETPLRSHTSQDVAGWNASREKILILGGGFGGVATALALDRAVGADPETSVLLVDRGNAQLFVPLLWTIANGSADAGDVMVPLRDHQRERSFHILRAEITGIDLDRRVVTTSAGERAYDKLVIALGSVTTIPEHIPGAREHAHVFRSPADAMQLRNRIIDAVEAAHDKPNSEERAAWLTFVVIGGGDTGTELAATIHDFIRQALVKEYPWLVDEPVRVLIIEALDRLVSMSSHDVSQRIRASLESRGIIVHTGAGVERIDDGSVLDRCAHHPDAHGLLVGGYCAVANNPRSSRRARKERRVTGRRTSAHARPPRGLRHRR